MGGLFKEPEPENAEEPEPGRALKEPGPENAEFENTGKHAGNAEGPPGARPRNRDLERAKRGFAPDPFTQKKLRNPLKHSLIGKNR